MCVCGLVFVMNELCIGPLAKYNQLVMAAIPLSSWSEALCSGAIRPWSLVLGLWSLVHGPLLVPSKLLAAGLRCVVSSWPYHRRYSCIYIYIYCAGSRFYSGQFFSFFLSLSLSLSLFLSPPFSPICHTIYHIPCTKSQIPDTKDQIPVS